MKRLLFVILLTIMGCCGVHVQAVGYEKIINPVLPGDRPDPTVIEINGEYWAAATSNEWSPLFPIFKSKDLVNWELVNYVFPDGAPDWALNNFWAPELSYDEKQGKVYLYYTARDKRTKRLSCAAAVADSPMGRFKDLGPLVAQEPGSIDAFAARDEKGKLYLIWKEDGNSMGLPTNIWAQEMTGYVFLKSRIIFIFCIRQLVVVTRNVIIKQEWPVPNLCWANGRSMKRIPFW